MKKFLNYKKIGGATLVEVLIASSIIVVFFATLVSVYNLYVSTALKGTRTVQAAYLLEEGIESIKFLRDSSWTTNTAPLNTNTPYYLSWEAGKWQTTTVNKFIDTVFERKVTVNSVNRNSGSNIDPTGSTYDANTKFVTVTVSWKDRNATTSQSVSTYITNLFKN